MMTASLPGIYTFLSIWTVVGLVHGIIPSPKQSGVFTLWNAANHVWMAMFGIFGLIEPVQRGSALAEYYLAHWSYGWWMDLHYFATARGIKLLEHLDVAVFPLSITVAALAKRSESFKGMLRAVE